MSADGRYVVVGAALRSKGTPFYDQLDAPNRVQILDLSNGDSAALLVAGPGVPAAFAGITAAWTGSGGLLSVNLATRAVRFVSTSELGGGNVGPAVALSSSLIAVPAVNSTGANFLGLFDTGSQSISGLPLSVSSVYFPREMRMRVFGGYAYVATASSAGIVEISVGTRSVNRVLPTPGPPTDVEVSTDGTEIFVAMPDVGQVAEIDRATGSILATAADTDSHLGPAGLPHRVLSFERARLARPGTGGATAGGVGRLVDFSAGTVVAVGEGWFWAPVLLIPPSAAALRALEPASASLIDPSTGAVESMPALQDSLNGSVLGVRLPDGRIAIARQSWSRSRAAPNPAPAEIGVLGTGLDASSGFQTSYPLATE